MKFLELLTNPSLTLIVFFPTLAAIPLLVANKRNEKRIKWYLLVVFTAEFLLSAYLVTLLYLKDGIKYFPLVADPTIPWLPRYGIAYRLAIDGISMPLILLTTFIMPIVILGSWSSIKKHWKLYGISLLILTTGILGAFLAYDLILFYIFWEVMLVPMYLIIGVWGGERRIYAAVKFFLYTLAGSLPMLLAILWLGWRFSKAAGYWSFHYLELLTMLLPPQEQLWLFIGFALAFAIKVPLFPLHTWLPDAHVEAPTGGSVILAAVLLKLGTYGFMRFGVPLFPHVKEEVIDLILVLSLIGIIYAALVAWVQEDMKKLIAYSSVAHLGFVTLGIFSMTEISWSGALLQMVNHGLSTGALFLLVGMIYERFHTKKFKELGGLAQPLPLLAFFLVFSAMASAGLPGLNGFVGELMILTGTYIGGYKIYTVIGAIGVILAALYLLRMLKETVWGEYTGAVKKDLHSYEKMALFPLAVLMLLIGIIPSVFIKPSQESILQTLKIYSVRKNYPKVTKPLIIPIDIDKEKK